MRIFLHGRFKYENGVHILDTQQDRYAMVQSDAKMITPAGELSAASDPELSGLLPVPCRPT